MPVLVALAGLLLLASSAAASDSRSLDGGLQHTCFVTPAGTIKCWGDNELGQLGDGTATERHSPVEVTGLAGATEVAAGASFTCALTGEGKVWCWGDNGHGQLGDGTTTERDVPVEVTGLPPAGEIAAGGAHACAITEALDVWCWGANEHGQLGDGTTTDRHSPVEVTGLPGAFEIAAGTAHTCARFEGKVWCWGDNEHGQLGDGTTTERDVPVEVTGISGLISQLTAGNEHTCSQIEYRIWCWGANEHGQLGDGTTTDRHSPVEVTGLPAAGLVSAGGAYTCNVQAPFFAWCWGDNEHGQLGDGTTTERDAPVEVTDFPRGYAVAAGGSHACNLTESGKVECWGDNEHGQLGDGTETDSSSPVEALSEPLGQRIAVQTFSDRTLGDPDFQISAFSTSGLDVTFTPMTPGVCAIDFHTIHLVGIGECKVAAEQAGDSNYAPAIPVYRRFQVGVAPGTGAISGRVTEESGEHGFLGEILVCALQDEEEEEVPGQNCSLTGTDGDYLIANLPLGAYRVEFSPRYLGFGYVSEYYDNTLYWSQAKPIAVTEGLVSGVDAALADGGEIAGLVTAASDGEPLGDVLVCAEGILQEFEECDHTGQDGTYRIKGLIVGKYRVSFLPPEGEGFRTQLYDGKSEAGTADPLQIAAGGVAEGVDAALEAEATISGLVSDASANIGLGDVEVCAFELTGFEFEACDLSDPTGAYTLTNLPAGQYRIGFFPEPLDEAEEEGEQPSSPLAIQFWDDEPSWESADILTLGLATADGIDARLKGPSSPSISQPVTLRPGVTPQPPSLQRPHCPAGKRRKTINGKSRCVKPRKRRHNKHGHRSHNIRPAH